MALCRECGAIFGTFCQNCDDKKEGRAEIIKKYAAKLMEIERLAVEVKLSISEDRGEPNLEMARRRISQIIKESQLGE